MGEHVTIRPEQLFPGIARAEADVETIRDSLRGGAAAIASLSDSGTWGADGPGRSFEVSYQANGGPQHTVVKSVEDLLAAVAEVHRATRATAEEMYAMDQRAAAALPSVQGA